MTTGAQLTFLEPGLAAGALENMPLRLQFRLCGSVTFRRLAGANAGRLPLPQQLLPCGLPQSRSAASQPLGGGHRLATDWVATSFTWFHFVIVTETKASRK
jgi:hypothetical protein